MYISITVKPIFTITIIRVRIGRVELYTFIQHFTIYGFMKHICINIAGILFCIGAKREQHICIHDHLFLNLNKYICQ